MLGLSDESDDAESFSIEPSLQLTEEEPVMECLLSASDTETESEINDDEAGKRFCTGYDHL